VNWSGTETTDTTRVFPGETEESTAAVLTNIASGDNCRGTLKIVCTFWRRNESNIPKTNKYSINKPNSTTVVRPTVVDRCPTAVDKGFVL